MSLIRIHLDNKSPKGKPKKKAYESGLKFYSESEARMFRSRWEIELAELLTSMNIPYEYEPKREYFKAEKESYLCDFYLPSYNVWIEVKGWLDPRSLRRIKLWRKYLGHTAGFILWEKEERELILKEPALLYTYIDIALEEMRRRQS